MRRQGDVGAGEMTGIVTRLQTVVRRRLMRQVGAVDVSRVDRVPDRLVWPLVREGFDPLPRLGELRESSPVAKLTSFLGLDVWLVTGDAEVREVLSHTTAFSNDIRPYVGSSGDAASGDIGGLG